ncbi:MAG: GNAT family N-acetyltransferase [Bacteroidales bacterium]|nr:GNAT family N-acetyltransferase [Bacteroidales bacterium]
MDKLQIHIREYQPDDFDGLIELWQLTGLDYPERGDDRSTIEECHRQGGKLLIMTNQSSNQLIGSSWMTFDGRRIFMHHFGIRPEYQNRGLGKMLLKESLKFIKSKGKQVKMEVHKENQAARHLYESAGFFAFTDYDIYMIRDFDEINI